MRRKKLMLLGGIRYLLPVIDAAHKLGAYVITADYLPDNIAHRYSDEYVNVSILDREAVLEAARERKIDGILSFGVDPGVVTAAYVADRMGLPSPPLESVEILQNKDRFRDFLDANGFNCPFHFSYRTGEDALSDERLRRKIEVEHSPVIVKPVDSAGSKGCTRVDSMAELPVAVRLACAESHSGRIIVEQFLELRGHQTGSDSFSVRNELVFCSFDEQYFDPLAANPYTPSAHLWPSTMPMEAQGELKSEIQRLIRILDLGTSIYNIEARVASDGRPYIMEISPRGGGNRLAEVLDMATGQGLIANCVRAALSLPLLPMRAPQYDGVWAEVVVHADRNGRYSGIEIGPRVKETCIVQRDIWVREGDAVEAFTGANKAIGTIVLRFGTHAEAEQALLQVGEWLKVVVS